MARSASQTRLICPLTGTDVRQMRSQMHQAVELGADMVECRLDFLDPPPTERQLRELLTDAPVEVIVTNRPERQGGRFRGSEQHRLEILRAAASAGASYVDLEYDVGPVDLPPVQTIRSFHDFDRRPQDLHTIAASLEEAPSAVTKLIFQAAGPEDALCALDLLRQGGKPRIALAMGQAGLLSRVLARKFSAFGTFAALSGGQESAPGQPTLQEMKALYRWDAIGPDTAVYGVIGCPLAHSLSPAIHNAAFAAAGIDAVYVPLLVQPGEEDFRRFMDALLARPWVGLRGMSVTLPHKHNACAYVGPDQREPLAARIGAVNTLTLTEGSVRGDNTDYAAAIDALCAGMGIGRKDLAGRKVAILGAGGVARAVVAGLRHYQADAILYNRTLRRAERLAEEFSCRAKPLEAAGDTEAEILINCTSIGMHPHSEAAPIERIAPSIRVVFDTVYNPLETHLVQLAAAQGRTVVRGLEMFINQAAAQFSTWTGQLAPLDVMRRVVTERLAPSQS